MVGSLTPGTPGLSDRFQVAEMGGNGGKNADTQRQAISTTTCKIENMDNIVQTMGQNQVLRVSAFRFLSLYNLKPSSLSLSGQPW